VLRLVGALDFTGGVGRETYRQSQNKCRLARTNHASGVSRRDVVGTPLGYERNVELDITPRMSRASGREGSDRMDVARKLRVRRKSKAPTSRSTP
jgi:hypothetical protein